MFKCSQCIFFNKNGFVEMSCHIDTCLYILHKEKRKGKNGDLIKSLILDNYQAENCKAFRYVDDIINLIDSSD